MAKSVIDFELRQVLKECRPEVFAQNDIEDVPIRAVRITNRILLGVWDKLRQAVGIGINQDPGYFSDAAGAEIVDFESERAKRRPTAA